MVAPHAKFDENVVQVMEGTANKGTSNHSDSDMQLVIRSSMPLCVSEATGKVEDWILISNLK